MNDVKQVLYEEYYASLGITPNNSRKTPQVQSRAALMVAMSHHMTKTSIGKFFGRDHSSIVHHCSKHEANMDSWPGYQERYLLAAKLCDIHIRYTTVEDKIKTIRIQINRLERLAKNLKQELV